MKAVRATGDGVELIEAPEPTGAGLRLRVATSGICGSDVHLVELGAMAATLGHEFAGTLDDGTPVAVDPSAPCGACDQCQAGAGHRCRTGAQRALGVAADGGMADTVLVDEAMLVALPAGLSLADACLVEPLGVAVHGIRVGAVTPDTRVAVVGGGTIGLATVAAARGLGCAEVALVARHPHQQTAGEQLGATARVDDEYDVVVEAAGTESALAEAAACTRPGGTVVCVSTQWRPVTFPGIPALMKELSFRWSFTYGTHPGGRDLDDAAALLAHDSEIAAALVTHRFPLEDAREAFRVAAERRAGAIKVVLEP
jgi:threonine dehydrogenase-like Zn-dependent dehydrogenase